MTYTGIVTMGRGLRMVWLGAWVVDGMGRLTYRTFGERVRMYGPEGRGRGALARPAPSMRYGDPPTQKFPHSIC